jgi:hypothetical protein
MARPFWTTWGDDDRSLCYTVRLVPSTDVRTELTPTKREKHAGASTDAGYNNNNTVACAPTAEDWYPHGKRRIHRCRLQQQP